MNSASEIAGTAVIVVAAGSGQRLGYGMPKAKVPLGGDTILTHALRGVAAAGHRAADLRGHPARGRGAAGPLRAFVAELQAAQS